MTDVRITLAISCTAGLAKRTDCVGGIDFVFDNIFCCFYLQPVI